MWQFLYALQDLGLFVYSCLKAFLPLPSLEALLIPLCVANPNRFWVYAIEGAIGTAIGGGIGYGIAYRMGAGILKKFASDQEIEDAQIVVNRYGILAIFIGAITPIPDFILAYIAGMMKMKIIPFLLTDGLARLLRSLLVGFFMQSMGKIVELDTYGMVFSVLVCVWLLAKYLWNWYQRK